jgi:putative oxidoreductase
MKNLKVVGRFLFALPFLGFAMGHFTNAEMMAGYAPFGGVIMVYITGLCLLLAAVSIMIQKYTAIATALLGVFLILTAMLVHMPGMSDPANAGAMPSMLKDLALAGASFFMSGVYASEEGA